MFVMGSYGGLGEDLQLIEEICRERGARVAGGVDTWHMPCRNLE